MFWTFSDSLFFISTPYKNFRSSPSSGENTSPQILHLTQNTLSDHQNNGAIGKLACLDHLLICYFLLPLHTIIL